MNSEVLYRKWRPQSFAEVAGQDPVTRTLRNAVASSKVAHAYMLCGPRGTGKTSLGRLIAKAVNCETPAEGDPCGSCQSCCAFASGNTIDLIEMDAASNRGIDEIRKLRDRVGLAPMGGQFKVYLIDEVHMLTPEAYNALLKTLEEPPPHIIFVLATTEAHKVPSTIVSRCQKFNLRRIPLPAVTERLRLIGQSEKISLEDEALGEIARAAGGSLRDAINMLEQVSAQCGSSPELEQVRDALGLSVDKRSGELAQLILASDLNGGLRLISTVRDDGVEMRQFSKQLVIFLRDLLLVKAGGAANLESTGEQVDEMKRIASEIDAKTIVGALRIFGKLDFRNDPLSSLPLELALVDYLSGDQNAANSSIQEATTIKPTIRPAKSSLEPVAKENTPPRQTTSKVSKKEVNLPKQESSLDTNPTTTSPVVSIKAEAGALLGPDFLEQLRSALRDVNKPISAFLNGSCEVKAAENNEITLGFYFPFHEGKISEDTNRSVVEEAASGLLGRSVTIRCVSTPAPTKENISEGELVRAARELGARATIEGLQTPKKKGETLGESQNESGNDEASQPTSSSPGRSTTKAR